MAPVDWHRFPSLSALRAFEAAASSGSFSAAARALNVTHAAIAQQVRGLERSLGVTLLVREGRGLSLTEDGARLAEGASTGFGTIAGIVNDITSQHTGRPLTVTMTPIFAEKWLLPRLKEFWTNYPEVPVSLRPDYRVMDLHRDRIDVAIRFGDGNWPGVEASFLTSARFVIVGAPSLWAGRGRPLLGDLATFPWITEGFWAEPAHWLAAQGIDISAAFRTELPSEELAMSAARSGLGLYVASAALVEPDLESGSLEILFDACDDNPGYYTVVPKGPHHPQARPFLRWLRSSV